MTLFSALRSLPDMEVVGLNFSSATTPELLLKTLDHYCEYRKTPNGMVLSPVQLGVWLVMFCDEINLPDVDSYGTQDTEGHIIISQADGGVQWVLQDWKRSRRAAVCEAREDPIYWCM